MKNIFSRKTKAPKTKEEPKAEVKELSQHEHTERVQNSPKSLRRDDRNNRSDSSHR